MRRNGAVNGTEGCLVVYPRGRAPMTGEAVLGCRRAGSEVMTAASDRTNSTRGDRRVEQGLGRGRAPATADVPDVAKSLDERVWVVRAGRGGALADAFEQHGVVAIGFSEGGDAAGVSIAGLRQRYVAAGFTGNKTGRARRAALAVPPGADGGTDVLAARDPLLVEPPILRVQVKAKPTTSMGAADVRELAGVCDQGEHGIFVSTGGFTRAAQNEAAKRGVRLIDLERLQRLLLDAYDQLDQDVAALLPQRRIYFP